ncbi:MAG TPA: hypothetical protein PKC49_01140 [Phycisphaerae bacterium]|nr:hypothetical protein [Phycisphaerae bacterium]
MTLDGAHEHKPRGVVETATRSQPLSAFGLKRSIVVAALLIGPLAGLGLAWLAIDRLLLAPRVPPVTASADEHVRFMAHPRGLPALGRQRAVEFLQARARRLAEDEGFRADVVAALNRSPVELRRSFESNLIDVLKPLVMADVERFAALPAAQRRDFIDGRIVAYNRLAGAYQSARLEKSTVAEGLVSRERLLRLLMEKTSERERDAALRFGEAYGARVQEVLADPLLKRDFEQRIAADGGAP